MAYKRRFRAIEDADPASGTAPDLKSLGLNGSGDGGGVRVGSRGRSRKFRRKFSGSGSKPKDVGFKPWMLLKLGRSPRSGGEFKYLMDRSEMRIGPYVMDIIDRIDFEETLGQIEFDLVAPRFKEVLLPGDPLAYSLAWDLMRELYRFQPCPGLVALKLRLAYADQPKGKVVIVGMEPILHPVIGRAVLGLNNESGRPSIDLYPVGHPSGNKQARSALKLDAHLAFIRPRLC